MWKTSLSASAGVLLLAASCQAGQTQEQDHAKTVREIQAELEKDLRGQSELLYGPDADGRLKAIQVGTPAQRNREIIDGLRVPSPPPQKQSPGTVSAAELRQTAPKRSPWKALSKRANALLGSRHAP